jgi:hypothetical protein
MAGRELEWRSSFGESLKLGRTLRGGHAAVEAAGQAAAEGAA